MWTENNAFTEIIEFLHIVLMIIEFVKHETHSKNKIYLPDFFFTSKYIFSPVIFNEYNITQHWRDTIYRSINYSKCLKWYLAMFTLSVENGVN